MGQIDKVFGLGRLTGTRVGHHGYRFCTQVGVSNPRGTFPTPQILPGFTNW
jgi:hypothetical protein